MARQAQSKEKTMAKMVAGGLTEKVVAEKVKWILKAKLKPLNFMIVTVLYIEIDLHFSKLFHVTFVS